MISNSLVKHMHREVHAGIIAPDLSSIALDIASAAIEVSKIVNRNVFDTLAVGAETLNTHGEIQHRLDRQVNDIFTEFLQKGNRCNYLISEECENTIELFNDDLQDAVYTLCLDPLDGSSNIDVNVSVGSIFSIYSQQRLLHDKFNPIKSGAEQQLAGYIIYGTSTMLVLTYGTGVNGFTLDLQSGDFRLTHPNIRLSKTGITYAINEGNSEDFPKQIRQYLAFCKQLDIQHKLPYRSRYVGSMVADMHRTLLQGGIFLYPSTRTHPNGKLRLLYVM